ncbi:MAG TPA: NADH-quinone oxidoreductase subunit J, partial [Cellulomonas sp.]|nr:NADH-quinone oxidoreductase subunit J [Cellulomonas sp.]
LRVEGGHHLAPLPAPGVYARHNAMDVPALDPHGNPIESSVPRVLRVRGQEADAAEYAARIDRVLAGRAAKGDGENPPPAGQQTNDVADAVAGVDLEGDGK